jgi:hypothetical protein
LSSPKSSLNRLDANFDNPAPNNLDCPIPNSL